MYRTEQDRIDAETMKLEVSLSYPETLFSV